MITKVTVLNADFKTVKTIDGAEELAAFNVQWRQKRELKDGTSFQVSKTHFKLDVFSAGSTGSSGKSTRWLYLPEGKVRVLTKAMAPDYTFDDPKAFNDVLGVSAAK